MHSSSPRCSRRSHRHGSGCCIFSRQCPPPWRWCSSFTPGRQDGGVTEFASIASTRIVGAGLGLLWLCGPQFYDDGWLMATTRGRLQSGTATNYFESWAATVPLGFLQHQLLTPFARTDAPFLLWRLVPLAGCLVTWRMLRSALRESDAYSRLADRTLAATVLLFAYAWLMNLRPEPTVAALSATVLLSVGRYRRDGALGPLCVATLCAAFAATMHPSGLVASAPLVWSIPHFWRDIRSSFNRAAALGAIAGVAAAGGVAALFADSDLSLWRANRNLFANDGFHNQSVFDEAVRYRDLLDYGTHARVASVLLAAAAILVALVDAAVRRRKPTPTLGYLMIGALLLAGAPTKWTFHFGSVAAIAALAMAIEAGRLAQTTSRTVRLVAALATVAVAFVGARAKSDAQEFLVVGLPMLRWTAIPLAVAIAVVLVWRAGFAPAALSLYFVVLTIALQIADPLVTGPVWTMARRGPDDLLTGPCSLADRLDVTDPQDITPLATIGPAPPPSISRVEAPGEMRAVNTFSTEPGASPGGFTTPWYRLPGDRRFVIAVAGVVNHGGNSVTVEWGNVSGESIESTATEVLRADRTPAGVTILWWLPWRVMRITSPPDVGAVRLVAIDTNNNAGGHINLTAPVSAFFTPLRSHLRSSQAALVSPTLQPHLPCADHAAIRRGIAEPPDLILGAYYNIQVSEGNYVGNETSPYYQAENSLPLRRIWLWLTDNEVVQILVRDDGSRPWALVDANVRKTTG